MVEKHVSLPKAFSGGDWNEWLLRFDICAEANGWKNDVRVVKLPTLLEGEALAVFTEIRENERKDYLNVTDALKRAFHMHPTKSQFSVLKQFEKKAIASGRVSSHVLAQSEKTLNAAMPELEDASKEKLLLHHFIAGLPEQCARQLRILPEIKTADALRRAQLIIDQVGSATQEETVMAIGSESKLAKLEHQVQYLTQKLTEVLEGGVQNGNNKFRDNTSERSNQRPVRCFNCGLMGHVQRNCRQGKGRAPGARAERPGANLQ